MVRPLLVKTPSVAKKDKKGRALTKEQILEQEYDLLFSDGSGNYKFDNGLYDLEIHNNLPSESRWMGKKIECDFCGKEHKDQNCHFAFEDDHTLEQILSLMKIERELEISIHWKPNAKVNLKSVESPDFNLVSLNGPEQGRS